MSNVPAPAVLSNPQSFRCSLCRNIVIASGDTPETPICRTCLHDHATIDALRLISDFRKLCAGQEPFDVLTPEERAEQIQQLMVTPLPDAELAKLVSAPQFTDAPREPFNMLAYAEQVVRGDWVPTREERKALEGRDEDEARCAILDAEREAQDAERFSGMD